MTDQVVLQDAATKQWLRFRNPCEVIETGRLEEVAPKLHLVESLVRDKGLFAAGFLSYEAAPAFDAALRVQPLDSFPLLWFGLYDEPEITRIPLPSPHAAPTPLGWTPSVDRAAYDRAIARIKDHLRRGETYQVNYTVRLHAPFAGDPWQLFLELVQAQQAEYTAYLDTGGFAICSASPELFFQLDGRRLVSRPMKGTAARGLTLAQDEEQAAWLNQSTKNRAENVMIVDMIRNDMGRVARPGTVRAPRLFEVERYPTLWQMTSTVTAETDASLSEIMHALFPCASITGAPKPRTMQIIADIETTPRRVYTGSIGFVTPDRRAQFNVAIRTVLVDRAAGQAEYGVGGGIVWDSVTGEEYTECQVKARVLTEKRPEFSLLETMLWTPDEGCFLLDYHLRRLSDSAVYFNFQADVEQIRQELSRVAGALPNAPHKVRLLVARNGAVTCEATPFAAPSAAAPVRLRLARAPIDASNPFLYHKTTHRQVYEAARNDCLDCDDVLLWNERGEITEATIANVVVRLDGELVTPPVRCGCLPGTYRAWLLDQGEAKEHVVSIDDLKRSREIFLTNSLRKQRPATLVD